MVFQTGIVVIGKNEGVRLAASLSSVDSSRYPILYVDSCSSDGSPQLARDQGVPVLELDPSCPMSAARGRNEGFFHLLELHPDLRFVQFLDGDSVLCDGWLESAVETLAKDSTLCAVTGHLHERAIESSIIKQVSLVDYRLPEGQIHCFCGNALVRVSAFQAVGGFNIGIPAGEEPELSQRLRNAGWRILSVPDDMAIHDSGEMTLSMWLRRASRSGFAYAHVLSTVEGPLWRRFGFRQTLRIWAWTLGYTTLLLLSFFTHPLAMTAVFLLLLVQLVRVGMSAQKSFKSLRLGIAYAVLWYLGLWAQLIGQLRFFASRLARDRVQREDSKEPEVPQRLSREHNEPD